MFIVEDSNTETSADALVAAARRQTGLTDFGPNRFNEALQSQLTSVLCESNMTEAATTRYLHNAVRSLSLTLRMQEFFSRHPEIQEQQIIAPVVIIGLQRTGTSKLFWNIAADPQWNVLYTWQALNPIPPADWQPGMPDSRLAEAKVWCEQQKFMAKAHRFEATAPEMEALLMAQTFMINGGPLLVPTHQRWLETADFTPVYRHLKRQLQFLQWQNRSEPGRSWILKSPPHLMSLTALKSVFPDAKLVMTHRHPLSSVGSMIRLGEISQEQVARQVDRIAVRDAWLRIMTLSIRRFMDVRRSEAGMDVIDVRFKDLVDDPMTVTREVYRFAGLSHTAETETAVAAWHAEHPQHKEGKFEYDLSDYGLTPFDIDSMFEEYISTYSSMF